MLKKLALLFVLVPSFAMAQIQSNSVSLAGAGTPANPLVVSQSGAVSTNGTDNINQVGGTPITLGTKASTASLPVTLSNDGLGSSVTNPVTVGGGVASGSTDSGSPIKIGGVTTGGLRINAMIKQGNGAVPSANNNFLTTASMLTADVAGNQVQVGAIDNRNDGLSYNIGYGTGQANIPVVSFGTIYNGGGYDRPRSLTAADSGAGLGVMATGTVVTSAASQGVVPTTIVPSNSYHVAKSTAGNLFNVNVENTVAGPWVIDYNATAAPAANATLNPSLILWHSMLQGSSSAPASLYGVISPPIYASNGHVLLYSTSLTQFIAPSTTPLLSTAMAK